MVMYKMVDNQVIEMSAEEVDEMKQQRARLMSVQWKLEREARYGLLQDQLDMLWHDINNDVALKDGQWFNHIKSIKDAVPKPEGA